MDRRDFLTALGAAIGAACTNSGARAADSAAAGAADTAAASAAGATGAAGQRRLARVGFQLYTARDVAQRDLAGTLQQLAQIGYKDIELFQYHGKTAAEVRAMLDANGLRSPSLHLPIDRLRNAEEWRKAIADAKVVGHEYLTIPWVGDADRGSVESWQRIASQLNEGARAAQAEGVKVAYHNHEFEFKPVGGQVPMDILVRESDPALVSFELDTYWAFHAGQDPVQFMTAHPNRVRMLHIKDSMGAPEHRMVDVGAGTMPWKAVLATGAQQGVQHHFVEHDNPGDPIASARASYAYLSALEY